MTKAIEIFFNNFFESAKSVLTTITNESLEFSMDGSQPFDVSTVSERFKLPLVLISTNYTGDQNFAMQIGFPTETVAVLADLMMMGDGSEPYNPDEHNEAAQEMFNQVLGNLTAGLAGESISINGTVQEAEQTELEAEQMLYGESTMWNASLSIIGKEYPIFFLLDPSSISSVTNLFAKLVAGESSASPEPVTAAPQAQTQTVPLEAPPRPEDNQPPVQVARAGFSELADRKAQLGYNNVNVELLMDIVLPITVELGRKNMRIKEILEMGQGSVIELDKLAGDFVDILVNGKKFAVGEIMVVEDNFAIRIVNLVSREDRIKSLGSTK